MLLMESPYKYPTYGSQSFNNNKAHNAQLHT